MSSLSSKRYNNEWTMQHITSIVWGGLNTDENIVEHVMVYIKIYMFSPEIIRFPDML